MQNATLRCCLLGLLLGLTATCTTLAAGPLPRHPGPDSPARREINTYVQANVLPTLHRQRQKLEAQLAPADQAALASYRTQLQALRSQLPAHQFGAASSEIYSSASYEQVRTLFAQRRAVMEHVGELARKYQPNLEKLAAEIQSQRARWVSDIQALAQKDAAPEQLIHRHFGGRHHELSQVLKPSAFLLLEPAALAEAPPLEGTSLYPNPAAASSQLQYEVKKAGPVSIQLLDAQGQPLRTLLPSTRQEAGTYTQPLDFSDLPSGTYFYKVTTEAGSETKRFVR